MKKTTKKNRKKGVASHSPTQEIIVKEAETIIETNRDVNEVRIASKTVANIMGTKLTTDKLQEAIILSEVLGKPVSKRRDRRSRVGRL